MFTELAGLPTIRVILSLQKWPKVHMHKAMRMYLRGSLGNVRLYPLKLPRDPLNVVAGSLRDPLKTLMGTLRQLNPPPPPPKLLMEGGGGGRGCIIMVNGRIRYVG